MVTFEDIAAAHERIKGAARRTPVLTSATVDALSGASVFFKCENFQRMGAFKFRGAYNALSQLKPEEKASTPCRFSCGANCESALYAPRNLNAPMRWKFSHLKNTFAPIRASTVAEVRTGVRRAAPLMRS